MQAAFVSRYTTSGEEARGTACEALQGEGFWVADLARYDFTAAKVRASPPRAAALALAPYAAVTPHTRRSRAWVPGSYSTHVHAPRVVLFVRKAHLVASIPGKHAYPALPCSLEHHLGPSSRTCTAGLLHNHA